LAGETGRNAVIARRPKADEAIPWRLERFGLRRAGIATLAALARDDLV
jgi:hypothetical protein